MRCAIPASADLHVMLGRGRHCGAAVGHRELISNPLPLVVSLTLSGSLQPRFVEWAPQIIQQPRVPAVCDGMAPSAEARAGTVLASQAKGRHDRAGGAWNNTVTTAGPGRPGAAGRQFSSKTRDMHLTSAACRHAVAVLRR